MTKEEFLVEMQDVLQTDDALTMETALGDLAEWDSLSMMATMAFLGKKFATKVTIADLKSFATIGDIAAAAGLK